MQLVADRAHQFLETKVIRRVRTEAGVRRFKQPIGSIIINDGLLIGLTDKGTTPNGRNIIEGANGKTYTIGLEGGKARGRYVLRDSEGNKIKEDRNEIELYVELGRQVQEEAGIDTRGPGGVPGMSRQRQGWSKNQVEAVSDEVAAWGNSMEEYGHHLQDALYEIADGLDKHRDIRVARHQLEQLRDRTIAADTDPDNAELLKRGHNYGAEATLNSAINVAITEGKLPRKYDAEKEAVYAAEALADARANANVPRPIKLTDIGSGMWIQRLDPKTNEPMGDWFQVRDVADATISGRSRHIRGRYRDGSRADLIRMSTRDKFQTVEDASDQAAFVKPAPPEKPYVTKKPHHLNRGDRIWHNGESMYVQDYAISKDDWSTPERRKNPVYEFDVSDDQAGKVNPRKLVVPKGTSFGPPPGDDTDNNAPAARVEPEAPASDDIGPDELRRVPNQNFSRAKSEYPGYVKYVGDNGKVFYLDRDEEGWDLYDENDNIVAENREDPEGQIRGLMDTLNRLSTSDVGQATTTRPGPRPGLSEGDSEYDGYEKFTGDNGEDFYIAKEGRNYTAYDKDDNVIVTSTRNGVLDMLSLRVTGRPVNAAERTLEAPKVSVEAPSAQQVRTVAKALGVDPKALQHAVDNAVQSNEREKRLVKPEAQAGSVVVEKDGGRLAVYRENAWTKPSSDPGLPWSPPTGRPVARVALDGSISPITTEVPKQTGDPAPSPLKRLKSRFDGWKRFKLPDGRAVDTGQATDDDNRWYATGKGGWDEIIADGDTEAEMMAKLNAIANPNMPPTTFSPGNTDVKPKRQLKRPDGPPVVTATAADRRRREQWRQSDNPVLRSIAGDPPKGPDAAIPPRPTTPLVNEDTSRQMDASATSTALRGAIRKLYDAGKDNMARDLGDLNRRLASGEVDVPTVARWLRARQDADGIGDRDTSVILRGVADRITGVDTAFQELREARMAPKGPASPAKPATASTAGGSAVPVAPTGMERALDEMSYEERVENLKRFTKYGPDYNRGATDDLNRAGWAKKKGEDDTANAWLVSAEENAGLRPRGAYNAHMTRRDEEAVAIATGNVTDDIRRVYESLASRPGGNVKLTDLRKALGSRYTPAQVDTALRSMLSDANVQLEPEAFGHRVGPNERRDAVNIGGEDRHHLAITGSGAEAPANKPLTNQEAFYAFREMGEDLEAARRMAREDPARFLEVMGEGAFGKDRRTRVDGLSLQADMREHLKNLRDYAQRVRNGEEVISSVVKRMKLETASAGNRSDYRAMRTIIKVLEEELGL